MTVTQDKRIGIDRSHTMDTGTTGTSQSNHSVSEVNSTIIHRQATFIHRQATLAFVQRGTILFHTLSFHPSLLSFHPYLSSSLGLRLGTRFSEGTGAAGAKRSGLWGRAGVNRAGWDLWTDLGEPRVFVFPSQFHLYPQIKEKARRALRKDRHALIPTHAAGCRRIARTGVPGVRSEKAVRKSGSEVRSWDVRVSG